MTVTNLLFTFALLLLGTTGTALSFTMRYDTRGDDYAIEFKQPRRDAKASFRILCFVVPLSRSIATQRFPRHRSPLRTCFMHRKSFLHSLVVCLRQLPLLLSRVVSLILAPSLSSQAPSLPRILSTNSSSSMAAGNLRLSTAIILVGMAANDPQHSYGGGMEQCYWAGTAIFR